MARSSGPPPHSSMRSQITTSAINAPMKRYSAPRAGLGAVIHRQTRSSAARCTPRTILELHACPESNRARAARHHERTRAAPASGRAADIDALVEQIIDEHFEIVSRPIQARVEVNQGCGVQASLELVRVLEIATSSRNQLYERTQRRRR